MIRRFLTRLFPPLHYERMPAPFASGIWAYGRHSCTVEVTRKDTAVSTYDTWTAVRTGRAIR